MDTRVPTNENPGIDDSSAADEPTAMWDANALKDLGLDDAAKSHEDIEIAVELAAPVTQSTAKTKPPVARPKTVPKRRKGSPAQNISMPMLLVIAVALGAAVYFGVSLALG
jgi:hypothetical protein